MFKRDILKKLSGWAEKKDRKPLILRGARQVGKTTAIHLFSERFDQYLYLNLEINEERSMCRSNKNSNKIRKSGYHFTPWQRCLSCLQLTWQLLFFGSDQYLFSTAHDDKSSEMLLSEERISYQVAPFRDPLFQYNSNS